MASKSLEEAFEAATADGASMREMAGAVLLAADESGIKYSKSFGRTSLDSEAPEISPDTVMWMASCTKFITSIAALQCVERGLLNLDDDIGQILPEWKNPQVVTGEDDENGKPILEPVKKRPTLRMLLSHSSGLMYPQMVPRLLKWIEAEQYDLAWASADIRKTFGVPLAFQPGTGWGYGSGIDWAGLLVEQVNGGIKLGEFMQKNIFEPLGMKDMTFHIKDRPELLERLMFATKRGNSVYINAMEQRPARLPIEPMPRAHFPASFSPKDDQGGSGLFGTPADYMKLLRAVLHKDSRLLKPETYDLMHDTQAEGPGKPMPINSAFASISRAAGMDLMGPRWDYGVASAVLRTDLPGVMREGSLRWTGMANTSWCVDRKSGIVTFFGTNCFPYEDYEVCDLQAKFHGVMLERFGKSSKL